MKFQTKTIIPAGDVADALASEVMDMRYNFGYSVQAKLTGSPSGDVVVQGTNDDPSVGTPVWSEIEKSTISGTTTIFFNKTDIMWPFIRVFKAAGGTGTLTVTMTIKGA